MGNDVSRRVTYSCTACDDFELVKVYSGRAGTPGDEEFERIEAPDDCPACGADVEKEEGDD